ncbi:MAG TPA: ABC transporter ATP-binding protein, partial [bacterium]
LAERIIWSLEFVNLSDRKRERVKRYSGGMKRRLNLAAALVHDPQVLLLDEPTAGVDPQSRIAIFENILTLKRDNRAVLFTTHYIEEAQKLCDRVGIMDHGRLLAMGKIDELILRHGGKNVVKAVRAGGEERIETDDPASVFNRLKTDPSLLSFRVDRPTLEDVFLNLTGRCLRD